MTATVQPTRVVSVQEIRDVLFEARGVLAGGRRQLALPSGRLFPSYRLDAAVGDVIVAKITRLLDGPGGLEGVLTAARAEASQ
ncbi:MAG TPA: hypothetical protein VFF79_13050 [Conexibacter sp.]|jgi:hypothetical protein|nr:hypothetical protein [Conexibacter sp.]